jgi:methyl-accepting chemotaxis protein
MKIITKIMASFFAILLIFFASNYVTYRASTETQTQILDSVQISQKLNENASSTRDLYLKVVSSVNKTLSSRNEVQYEAMSTLLSSDTKKFTEQVKHEKSAGVDIKLVNRLNRTVDLINQTKLNSLREQRNVVLAIAELENIVVTSDIALKRVMNTVRIDEFLRKDIDAFVEKRNAILSLIRRSQHETDIAKIQRADTLVLNMREALEEDAAYVFDELPELSSEKDYQTALSELKKHFFSEQRLSKRLVSIAKRVETLDNLDEEFVAVGAELELSLEQVSAASIDANRSVVTQIENLVDNMESLLFRVSVGVTLLTLGIAFYLTKEINQPIQYIVRALSKISSGDYTVRIDSNRWSTEFQSLLSSLSMVVSSNRSLIDQIQTSNQEITRQCAQNAKVSDDIQARSEEQSSAMIEISVAVEELEQISTVTKQTIERSLEHTQEVTLAVEKTIDVVKENTQANQNLSKTVAQSAQQVSLISDSSRDIGEILGVIEEIAHKTNLLALNAAIEAARAGDQGRGFAVVADEVSALAKQTSASTNRIQSMIDNLTSVTNQAVDAMYECERIMEESNTHRMKLEAGIDIVGRNTKELASEAQTIMQSAIEQNVSCTQIAQATNMISQSTTKGVEQLKGVTERSHALISMVEQQHTTLALFNVKQDKTA